MQSRLLGLFLPNFLPFGSEFALFFIKIFFDSLFCFMRCDKSFPITIRSLILRSDDLNLLAILQFIVERDNATIHFCPNAMQSDCRMDIECKIHGCGIHRKYTQFAFGRKYLNFLLIEIEFKTFKQLLHCFIATACIIKNISHPIGPLLEIFPAE